MEKKLTDLLRSWDCSNLQYYFFVNGIKTYDSFCSLDPETLHKIIPDENPLKIQFMNIFNMFTETIENSENTRSMHVDNNENSNSEPNVFRDITDCLQNEKARDCYHEVGNDIKENLDESDILVSLAEIDKFRNYRIFYSNEQKENRIFKLLDNPDNLMGNIILYKYIFYKDILKYKKVLSNMLLQSALNDTKMYKKPFHLNKDDLLSLRDEVIKFFPELADEKESWYQKGFNIEDKSVSTSSDQTSGKRKRSTPRVNATGYLQSEYMLIRTNLREKAGLLELVKRSDAELPVSGIVVDAFDLSLLLEIPDNLDGCTIESIKKCWRSSYDYRHKYSPETGLDIIKKFKILKSEELGKELILNEFELDKKGTPIQKSYSRNGQL